MARPLAFVNIIVPYHGQYSLVRRCLESLWRNTHGENFQICLVDDGSEDGGAFFNSAVRTDRVTGVRLPERRGFGAAVAAGLGQTDQPWVALVQSDCEAQQISWLAEIRKTMTKLRGDGVKLVVPRTNSVGSGNHSDHVISRDDEERADHIATSPLPLHTFVCHRELFKRIGGNIRSYPLCGYEDEELFYRMKYYGFKQAVSGRAWIKHEGGKTISEILKKNPAMGDVLDKNRDLCLADIRSLKKQPA